MDWVGASVMAPRPDTPIEFEIASEAAARKGYFRVSTFYCDEDPAGYPRRMIRRWRYLMEESALSALACAIG